jgi:GR25 family glycosyltransferase involved in LPS biosynthesis
LIERIGSSFTSLGSETVAPTSLAEAERMAAALHLNFNHIQEDRKTGRTGFTKGEIGLWLSTILALRKFLETEFDVLVLFEDDIVVQEDGINLVNQFLSKIPRSFDFFILFTPENQYPIYGRKRHVLAFLRKNLFFDDPNKLTGVYQHWSSGAYALSRKGAQNILESIQKEISLPLDWHLFRGKFKSFCFKPQGPKPFSCRELPSTIQVQGVQGGNLNPQ